MKKILSIFITACIFFIFQNTSDAFAQTITNTSSSEMTVPQPKGIVQVQLPFIYYENGVVHADAVIKNDTKSDISQMMYGIQILSPLASSSATYADTETNPNSLVGYQDYDFFSLKKGQSITQKMSYPLGNTFAQGTYRILLQVRGADNGILGYQTKTFFVRGNGSALELDPNKCHVSVGNTTYELADGPILSKNQNGVLTCDVTNHGQTSITISHALEYAIRSVSFSPSKTTVLHDPETITLSPGETKTVKLSIPHPTTPQVYQGYWYFTDDAGNKASSIIVFRWTIPGPSATILGVNADKNAYTAGQTATIAVMIDPSADLTWRDQGEGTNLNNATLKVTITNTDGTRCGETILPLPKTTQKPLWPTEKVKVPITKDCLSFTTKAVITNDEKPLAQVSKKYDDTTERNTILENANASKNKWLLLIVLATIGILGIALFILYKKGLLFNSQKTTTMVFGFFLSIMLFLSIQKVFAAVEYAPVDSPIENRTLYMEYMGRSFWGNVSNFSSVTSTGRSSFSVSSDCSTGTLYVYGYADAAYCGNFHPGLQIQVFIDGQPVTVTNVQSPESLISTITQCDSTITANSYGCPHGSHEFYLDASSIGGGLRTGTATLSVPAAAQSIGSHTIDVHVGVGGRHYGTSSYLILSSFSSDKYLKLTTPYTCGTATPTPTTTPVPTTPVPTATPAPTTPPGIPTASPTPVIACGTPCTTPTDCTNAINGCTACITNTSGQNVCAPSPACGVACSDDRQCAGARNGCSQCVAGACHTVVACGSACTTRADCAATRDSCTECLPNTSGTGNSCQPLPACGTACTKDTDCTGARNGCTSCNAGRCTAFRNDMCKCDGMDFQLTNGTSTFFPGDNVTFIAFGKVEGNDINYADLQSMKFSLYQASLAKPNDTTRIAQSVALTPAIIQSDSTKVRYQVTWNQKIPSTVPPGTLFRVQADITCVAKPGVLGAKTTLETDNYFIRLYNSLTALFSKGNVLSASDQQLQLDPFYPGAKIQEKSCKIIQFFFE